MKQFFKNKLSRRVLIGLSLAIMMAGGVFVKQIFADPGSPVTPASGGSAVSIDTTSNADCVGASCNTWTEISGLVITESSAADIAVGVHVLTLPTGWEFDPTQTVTLSTYGQGLTLSSLSIHPSANTFTFTVNATSTNADKLFFDGYIKVRPTGKTPATGNITMTSGVIAGVDGSTNFGTLTSIAGTIKKLGFTTQPTNTVYDSVISGTVIKTQDQFGNNSVVGLTGDKTVSLVSSAGTLSGTISGTVNSGNSGTITFSDLKIDPVATGYTLTADAADLTSATSASFNITAKPLTISGLAATSKTYDKSTTAALTGTPSLVGIVGSDDVTLDGTAVGTFNTKDYGTGKTVTVSGLSLTGAAAANYSLTPLTLTADINKVALTVAGAVSVSKTYNGNTTATANFGSATLTGVLAPETVGLVTTGYSATFDNKNVGTGKTVAISGLTLDGADAGNYSLTQPSLTDGEITQAAITVTANSSQTKVYGATDPTLTYTVTSGGLIGGDTFSGALARAAGEDVGTTYAISQGTLVNSNYNITFVPANFAITAKPITVTATAGQTKVYGATDPTLAYTNSPALIGSDSFTGSLARAAGENVGTTYAINQGTLTNSNYNITFVPANFAITAKPLTISGLAATSKTYDKSTTAALTGTPSLVGIVGSDDVTLDGTAVGTFNTKDYGTGKTVTVSGLSLTGAAAANYSLTPLTLTADINKVALTVAGAVSVSKTYNGNTTATANFGSATLTGVLAPETVGLVTTGYSATFDNKNVGTGKTVAISGLTLDGADAGNYSLTQPSLTDGEITQAAITVTANSSQTKVYGATDPTLTYTVTSGGLIGGDTFSGALARAAGEDVGTTYAISQGTLANSNYNITFVPANFAITAKPLTISGVVAIGKVYDGNTVATLNTDSAALVGIVNEGEVTLTGTAVGAFADANAAVGKSVTVTGYTLGGAKTANYSLTQPTGLTATITKFTPVITWATPSDITAGTALSGAQLNAAIVDIDDNPLAGTFTYNPASGAVFTAVGTQTLSADFAPTDANNYNTPATKTVSINIIPAAIAKLQISADPTNLSVASTSVITVTGQDQYGNTTTGNNTTQPVLYADNGGSLAASVLTLTSGVATTSLSKVSAGVSRVNASSGSLIPTEVAITFAAGPSNPVIAITAPAAGATLSATTTLTFTTNSGATTDAQISIDGGAYAAATTNANPGTYILDTASLANGSHTLRVKDTVSGLTGYSDYVTFLVANALDTTRPLFVSQIPAASSTGVSITPDDLYVSFNEALDPATIGSTTVMLCLVSDSSCANPVNIGSPMLMESQKMIRLGGANLTLDYATPYWIKVTTGITDLAGNHLLANYGSTTTSQFTTESAPTGALAVGNISQVRYWGVANGGYDNGWEWVMPATIPTNANHFHLKFANWTSGGNTLSVSGNMKYWSEEITSGLSGSESNPVLITAADTYPDDIILNTDNNTSPDAPGMQTNIHIQVQIPSGQAGGSYSTSYGIDN